MASPISGLAKSGPLIIPRFVFGSLGECIQIVPKLFELIFKRLELRLNFLFVVVVHGGGVLSWHDLKNHAVSMTSRNLAPRVQSPRFIAGLSRRWRNRFSRSKDPSPPEHLRRGASGEKLAGRFLRRNGYKILYRNFRGRTGGEIDIVCREADTLVFVEVKTRTHETFGRPFDAISRQQQQRISRGALAWLRLLDNPDVLFRFDVVEVILPESGRPRLELIKDAFKLSAPYIY